MQQLNEMCKYHKTEPAVGYRDLGKYLIDVPLCSLCISRIGNARVPGQPITVIESESDNDERNTKRAG